jgi:hypothetical protein
MQISERLAQVAGEFPVAESLWPSLYRHKQCSDPLTVPLHKPDRDYEMLPGGLPRPIK